MWSAMQLHYKEHFNLCYHCIGNRRSAIVLQVSGILSHGLYEAQYTLVYIKLYTFYSFKCHVYATQGF